jgi:hypothetical protein
MPNKSDPRWPELPSRSDRRIAADVRAELEGWIEERTAELIREGVPGDEAKARAHEEFGDLGSAHARIVEDDRSAERLGE